MRISTHLQVKLVAAQVGVNAKADQFYTFLFVLGVFLLSDTILKENWNNLPKVGGFCPKQVLNKKA